MLRVHQGTFSSSTTSGVASVSDKPHALSSSLQSVLDFLTVLLWPLGGVMRRYMLGGRALRRPCFTAEDAHFSSGYKTAL